MSGLMIADSPSRKFSMTYWVPSQYPTKARARRTTGAVLSVLGQLPTWYPRCRERTRAEHSRCRPNMSMRP